MKYFCKRFVSEKYSCVYVIDFQHVTQNDRGGEGVSSDVFCVVQTPHFRKKKNFAHNFKKTKNEKREISHFKPFPLLWW